MTSDPDPLELRVRRSADAVPLPSGLADRIRRSVARKRRIRAAAAAAGLLLVASLSFLGISSRKKTPEDPAVGPSVSLTDPSPPPAELRKCQFTARVSMTPDGLVFRFNDGGKGDE